MVRMIEINLASAEVQAICSKPCSLYGVRVTTALSAHIAQVNNGSASVVMDTFAASEAIGVTLEFYGGMFTDGAYIKRTNASASGKLLCFYEETTL